MIRDRPILTDIYLNPSKFNPEEGSLYIYGSSAEERSSHSDSWEASVGENVEFLRITEEYTSEFVLRFRGNDKRISLRSKKQLESLLENVSHSLAYLDITGLSHHIWAPLLRTLLTAVERVMVVYVEPSDYRFSTAPTEGEIFDLSERIMGISPIPGFVSFTEAKDDKVCFIPLLGFEGTRLAYLIEQVQPPRDKIVPIIGVPGFHPEYPFFTYHGNQLPLSRTQAWKNVHFATANCPFSLFYTLENIAGDYPEDLLKIAPIGTKPHALGAVLYYITHSRSVELVYDHPIRKARRTTGAQRLLAYEVSSFVSHFQTV